MLESYTSAAKAKRVTIRSFKYNPSAFSTKVEQTKKLVAEKGKQESFMIRVSLASFSDVCIAWVHIKAMRYALLSERQALVVCSCDAIVVYF